jgi:hypothetical protein
MTDFTFKFQMRRLMDTFGEKNYPHPRVQEIAKECVDLSDQSFERIVTGMVREIPIKYPPTVATFVEYAETERKRLRDTGPVRPPAPPPPSLHQVYKTGSDALEAVDKFYQETIAIENAPEGFGDQLKELSARLFPVEFAEVQSLKSLVKAGSIEARGSYVEKSKMLIRKTTVRALFNGVRSLNGGSER